MSFDFQGFNDVASLNTAISRITYQGGPFLLGKKKVRVFFRTFLLKDSILSFFFNFESIIIAVFIN